MKRLKIKSPFDPNKLYCSEILSILLQGTPENRQMLGDIDGIDILLQQLAVSDLKMSKEFFSRPRRSLDVIKNCFFGTPSRPIFAKKK